MLTRTGLAAATTFVAASITYPLDIIRKRLIINVGSEEKMHSGFRATVSRIYMKEGVKGFYRFYLYDMCFRWACRGGGGGRRVGPIFRMAERVVCELLVAASLVLLPQLR